MAVRAVLQRQAPLAMEATPARFRAEMQGRARRVVRVVALLARRVWRSRSSREAHEFSTKVLYSYRDHAFAKGVSLAARIDDVRAFWI